MPVIMQGLSILTMALWPLMVWLSLHYPGWHGLLPLATGLFVVRWLASGRRRDAMALAGKWLAAVGVALSLASLLLRDYHLLMWYPVAVNVLMLLLFGSSLFTRMPLVERLARLREPDLPPAAIAWTRQVTRVWCLFFVFNGTVALVTCLSNNLLLWTWWNGLIGYLLMGLLMATEWLLRQRLRKRR